jgi:RHS repeat-associated protein
MAEPLDDANAGQIDETRPDGTTSRSTTAVSPSPERPIADQTATEENVASLTAEGVTQLAASSTLQTTVIDYDYDPLYRLTDANYTGVITASYAYDYDAVGNMTAYTETVEGQTTQVGRTFDAANQLLTSYDGSETTDYSYDNNGNLLAVTQAAPLVPGGKVGQGYSYDQRNLLRIGYTIGPVNTLDVDFIYDGDGNRLQQIDHTGSTPITTTYTNDNTGLSQVLVSDDGATATANIFGLDLIYQDDGADTRTLLADGLGSARMEMVGSAVETVTTYSPYGELLAQTGDSGTTYGFTGEQHDDATDLVYLRARYYNPGLKVFMSHDPLPGYAKLPQSQNGYSYAHNNPVLLTDPSGEIVPLIVGGLAIGAVTGVTWDVMVKQGAGGIDNLISGAIWDNLRCRVDWDRALLSGGAGSLIGGVAAPLIATAPSAAGAAYNAAPSAYAQWLYYSGFKFPTVGKAVSWVGTGIGLSDTISDNVLRLRALLGDRYAQSMVAESMVTWNPTLGITSLGAGESKSQIRARAQAIVDDLEPGDFIEAPSGSMSVELMAALQEIGKTEFILVRLQDGRRVLGRGGTQDRINIVLPPVKRVIAHTHPHRKLSPSMKPDVYNMWFVERLSQHSSAIITEFGQMQRFFKSDYQELIEYWTKRGG